MRTCKRFWQVRQRLRQVERDNRRLSHLIACERISRQETAQELISELMNLLVRYQNTKSQLKRVRLELDQCRQACNRFTDGGQEA